VFKLRGFGLNAIICYDFRPSIEVLKAYRRYQCPFITSWNKVEDSSDNLVIVPEIWTQQLSQFRNIKKAIWWLSVDNHFEDGDVDNPLFFDFNSEANQGVIHFAQSTYAKDFLEHRGVKNAHMLEDYLHQCYFKGKSDFKRESQAVYFPKKSKEHVELLKKNDPSIKWVAIENMKPYQVGLHMRKSKVYVDFGRHPGRDRVPREAVINGCCIIVGTRGSAKFYEDVPIPDKYKFSSVEKDARKVITTIHDCFTHYEERVKDMECYHSTVQNSEKKFEDQIRQIFDLPHKSSPLDGGIRSKMFFIARYFLPAILVRWLSSFKEILERVKSGKSN